MKFIANLLLTALAVYLLANFLPGVAVEGYTAAFIVTIVLALLNAVVKPILVFLTLPVTVLTLGLFLLVINIIIVYLADFVVGGFFCRWPC